ncbi:MAG: tRNA (adenosine(37)-N6)-dimethylallyltransferase MiaA [Bacteroidota bacterium]
MNLTSKYDLIVISGPTATGKTSLASKLAFDIDGEIISADSRQVYRKMDIGTGKDLSDYIFEGKDIKYHLIDIVEPGYKYSVFEFQRDFLDAYNLIKGKNKVPILCGGTGLYIEAAIGKYRLLEVPENEELRNELELKTMKELIQILNEMKKLHNTTDIKQKARLIRAIEIESYYKNNPCKKNVMPSINHIFFATNYSRTTVRERITERLKYRLASGMIDEVQKLLDSGLTPDDLIYYGLEYKYITQFIIGEISYNKMFELLNTAIHQFAKRQMTWFRRMERKGFDIIWIDKYEDIMMNL